MVMGIRFLAIAAPAEAAPAEGFMQALGKNGVFKEAAGILSRLLAGNGKSNTAKCGIYFGSDILYY
jgi:hypothetical protein